MRIHPLFARPAGSNATGAEGIEVDLFAPISEAFTRTVVLGGLVCDPILVYRAPSYGYAGGR